MYTGEVVSTLRKLLRIDLLPVLRRLPAYARLAAALLREPTLKLLHKAILIGGLAYVFSPIDLVPGVIAVLGQIDDVAVALWTLRLALRTMPPEAADRHLAANGLTWETLDADLAQVGRTGRLIVRAGLKVGHRAVTRLGRPLVRLGLEMLDRSPFVRRLSA
jgi:uncharacterized membrane protein YkvA (DUF1232 family)